MSRHESLRDKTLGERALILLPFYAAAFIVLLCGVSAVNSTIDDSGLTSITVILSFVGVASSFVMRVLGVNPGLPAWVISGLLILFRSKAQQRCRLDLFAVAGEPRRPYQQCICGDYSSVGLSGVQLYDDFQPKRAVSDGAVHCHAWVDEQ